MNQNAAFYYNESIGKTYQNIENQINAVPQLSIEEQSRLVDINQKYSTENQEKGKQL